MTSSRWRKQTFDHNVIIEYEKYNSPIELDEEFGVASMAEGMQGSSQKGKKKATIWNYFDLEMSPNEYGVIKERAICKVCKKLSISKSSCGTSHLLRHRKKCEVKHSGGVEPRNFLVR